MRWYLLVASGVAGLCLLPLIFGNPTHNDWEMGVAIALGLFLGLALPPLAVHLHLARQNRLMEQCRAFFIAGSQAWGVGDTSTAEQALTTIRQLERRWRFRNGFTFRVAHFVVTMLVTISICSAARLLVYVISNHVIRGQPDRFALTWANIELMLVFSLLGISHVLMMYWESWRDAHQIYDCGDRLGQLLHGPRAIISAPARSKGGKSRNSVPEIDGLSPHQIFGLGFNFTRRQLDAVRRRLVKELHPDAWPTARPEERKAREAALKRVNAAYDELRVQAV